MLVPKLRTALKKLNPDLAGEAINLAIEELTRDRGAMSLVQANRELYKLLKDGVKVAFENDEGEETDETVGIIDWTNPENCWTNPSPPRAMSFTRRNQPRCWT